MNSSFLQSARLFGFPRLMTVNELFNAVVRQHLIVCWDVDHAVPLRRFSFALDASSAYVAGEGFECNLTDDLFL